MSVGHPVNGLLTVMNQYKEIVTQSFLLTKSHEELRGALTALQKRHELHGLPGPSVSFNDDCCEVRNLLEDLFPSLGQNKPESSLSMPTRPLPLFELKRTPDVLDTVLKVNSSIDKVVQTVIQQEVTRQKHAVVGLDMEWDIKTQALGTLQLAFVSTQVFVIRLALLDTFPDKLKQFLLNPSIIKVRERER